jgi:hypothetical protein
MQDEANRASEAILDLGVQISESKNGAGQMLTAKGTSLTKIQRLQRLNFNNET